MVADKLKSKRSLLKSSPSTGEDQDGGEKIKIMGTPALLILETEEKKFEEV
jgi:hypothetical protein